MARIEHINQQPYFCRVEGGEVLYSPHENRFKCLLPQIFWANQAPWQEANLWLYERVITREVDVTTAETNVRALLHYANFLELRALKWDEFPAQKSERCLVMYRGFLIKERETGKLASSTVSARMAYVIAFYRWVMQRKIMDVRTQQWTDKRVFIKYFDSVGFERTLARVTTDLSIPNRARLTTNLEDGLLPVSAHDRDKILSFARESASPELFLMLSLGFFTGMRLGTICDLKIGSLDLAVPDPIVGGMYHISVGPGASVPVHTKFGINGQVWITKELLEVLKDYSNGVRRLTRQQKASGRAKQLLFLTRYGNPYSRGNSDRSSAVNVEMGTLRKNGARNDIKPLSGFRFHQSRCTFGTELALLAIRAHEEISALAFVRDALLHKDEATTLKYIKFVRNAPLKKTISDAFSAAFVGVLNPVDRGAC